MEREESSKQALQLNNEQITTVEPIVFQDSKMKTQKEKIPVGQARNIEAMLRRTPPHSLNQHDRKQFNINESTSMNHPVDSSSINPTYTSNENYGHFGFPPASFGGSSFLPQNRISYAGVVPQEGQTRAYLYFPKLSSYATNTSTPSTSLDKEGTPRAHDNHSDHLRLIHGGNNLGGSNPRAGSHQLHHQLSSFYPVVLETHGNNWNYFHGQQPAQYHYVQRGRKEQPPLPSYWSSQNTNHIGDNANTRPTSSSILGKSSAASNPAQSFFQARAPVNAHDMGLAHGPQCELQTDDLVRLVQSVGTPEFVANSERVLRLGSSLYEPHHAASAHVQVSSSTVSEPSLLIDLGKNNGEEVLGSGSSLYEPYHAAAAHVPVSSGTVSQPSLLLSLGNGNGDEKGKGKEVSSYWDLSQLSAMAKSLESMKKQRQETSQPLPVKTRGLDGQGCSKSNMQRCPWN